MNGIIGMTELALATELTREQREYLQLSRSSAESLLQVINSILDSKIEAGQMELEAITFDVRTSIGDTVGPSARELPTKGWNWRWILLPMFPNSHRRRGTIEAGIGQSDRERGGNSRIKAKSVRVAAQSSNAEIACLLFEVSDTGMVSLRKHNTIFESFQQADGSTTREFGGSGLGPRYPHPVGPVDGRRTLAGKRSGTPGSRFLFTARLGQVAELRTRPNPAPWLNWPMLLCWWWMTTPPTAADPGMPAELMGHAAGCGVERAQALRMMEEAHQSGTAFPLVLLDFQMPQMDGFAVVERIKKTDILAAATIMMLTSGGKRGDAARCRELGVAAYLTKPIRQAELFDAICLALGKKSAENEAAPLITRHSIRRERRRPLQVLVDAENNLVNQMLVVTLLMKAGHEVALVGNGVEALKVWKTQSFDVNHDGHANARDGWL